MSDHAWMRAAIDMARQGIARGQTPFGACIVRDGQLVAGAHNRVWETTDITAHAEVVAIRMACDALKTIDLSGCVLYSTCEPCPMCFSAAHWARISRIVFGASIADARSAGFNELTVSNEMMKREGGSPMAVVGGVLREECAVLFDAWKAHPARRAY
jgi:tRNA(Arg) A34 adenosine deaminase TadA